MEYLNEKLVAREFCIKCWDSLYYIIAEDKLFNLVYDCIVKAGFDPSKFGKKETKKLCEELVMKIKQFKGFKEFGVFKDRKEFENFKKNLSEDFVVDKIRTVLKGN